VVTVTEAVVRVRRRPDPEQPEAPWLSELVTAPGEVLGDVHVGRFATMHEAVTRGCTALRFVAAGIPWRGDR
jgi:hypothetical protein